MKVLFDFTDGLPEDANLLIIEMGNYGISFVWVNSENETIIGIRKFQFSENSHPSEFCSYLRFKLDDSIFRIKKTSIFINNEESLLIPPISNIEDINYTVLDYFFGKGEGTILKEKVEEKPSIQSKYNVFRIHGEIETIFKEFFPGAEIHHSSSFISHSTTDIYIRVIIYHTHLKIILSLNGELKLIQFYPYKTPSDVAWYILNICNLNEINHADQILFVSGMIEENSNLYNELTKYFQRIELVTDMQGIKVSEKLTKQPLHYFSHLIPYIKCEL